MSANHGLILIQKPHFEKSSKSSYQRKGITGLDSYSDNSTVYGIKTHWDPRQWSFKQLSFFYQKPNGVCLSNRLGQIYDHKQHTLTHILCDKVHCDRCRPNIKKRLREKIRVAVDTHKLVHHIIITAEGQEYRKTRNYQESYQDMAAAWNKIRKILNTEAKKQGVRLTYICMFRAQSAGSGYCHLHILANWCCSKQRLQQIVNNYECTGFIKIKDRVDTSNYLTQDFNKDGEWYIPMGRRHYSCSRNVDLNIYKHENEDEYAWQRIFDNQIDQVPDKLHIMLGSEFMSFEHINEQIMEIYGYPAPLDHYIKRWINAKPPPNYMPGGLYINGRLVRRFNDGV